MEQTIAELTNNQYNELRFSAAAEEAVSGPFISTICSVLSKCGIDMLDMGVYDEVMANAISQFQSMAGMSPTGILNNNTWQAMLYYADKMSDTVDEEGLPDEYLDDDTSDSPHYNSFFDTDKYKMHRRNHKDIKIILGNSSIIKTIKDVFMRSLTVEVDTSGNPISEVYEFIARDIKESDEISDVNKYIGEEGGSSSDIKYKFNFQ